MALLFAVFLLIMLFIVSGWRFVAFGLALLNLILTLCLFWHHVTTSIDIRL